MYKPLEIKICGINDIASMKTAIKYKADYIGLVFFPPSPRNVSFAEALNILKYRNKDVKIVALTVDPTDELLLKIKTRIHPEYIQLHGNETPKRCFNINKLINLPIIKGIGVQNNKQLLSTLNSYDNYIDMFILDAPKGKLPGGNGDKFNWNFLKNIKLKKKWLLAGGLNIKNIEEAINTSKTSGIDVSSGVEIKPGLKESKLIKDFIIGAKTIIKT